MRTVVIVQARMTSTRLPGKVLEVVAGRSILDHVLRRCAMIPNADAVCCAVPAGADHDPIAAAAQACGAEVFRGSENDVLARYHGAALIHKADRVLRVTSDCPLIDPWVCGKVIEALSQPTTVDFAANNFVPGFPHGLDCEAFTRAALARAWAEATETHDREHVGPWMRRSPEIRRRSVDGPDPANRTVRWTLDHPEDLDFFRAFLPLLEDRVAPWTETLALYRRHPEIAALNARHA